MRWEDREALLAPDALAFESGVERLADGSQHRGLPAPALPRARVKRGAVASIPALVLLFGLGCQPGDPVARMPAEELASPAAIGSGQPYLASAPAAHYLSWLESAPGGHRLRLARLGERGFQAAVTVREADDFFVNHADTPSVAVGADGTLWVHWPERGSSGGYDYAARVVRSIDGGRSWSEPWTLHGDASPTEHGFVSMLPFADGMGFVWLDGRRFVAGVEGTATGEMQLRYRRVGADGTPGPEQVLDPRVCDCCQTATAAATPGPIVVYRDRDEKEIRDIGLVRRVDGSWTEAGTVHADGWYIEGCPVNGPALAARGAQVAVAWFTAARGVPQVQLAFSRDGGASFAPPQRVDAGDPVGHVDVVAPDEDAVWVSWLERSGDAGTAIRLRRVGLDGTRTAALALDLAVPERPEGFPRMAAHPGGPVLLAWTDRGDTGSRVRVLSVELTAR